MSKWITWYGYEAHRALSSDAPGTITAAALDFSTKCFKPAQFYGADEATPTCRRPLSVRRGSRRATAPALNFPLSIYSYATKCSAQLLYREAWVTSCDRVSAGPHRGKSCTTRLQGPQSSVKTSSKRKKKKKRNSSRAHSAPRGTSGPPPLISGS
jgi:hypothetical protein